MYFLSTSLLITVLSDRGTNVNFILQRKNGASERITAKVMQAVRELESEALDAFSLAFFFFFFFKLAQGSLPFPTET